MSEVNSIGFALDPTNVPSFLLDWELTKLCNLDCSYCDIGINGGHDNSTKHPPLEDCLRTIDFMYQDILDKVKLQLDTGTMPIIKCVKDICMCGFCAPKADNLKDFKELLSRNLNKENNHGQTI